MTVNRPNTTFLAISYIYPSGDLNKKYKLSGKMFSLKNDNCIFFWLYFSIVLRKNEPEILAFGGRLILVSCLSSKRFSK